MKKEISHQFGFLELVGFSFPAIIMLLITSLYTAVDGIFISRYVGSDGLSSVNIMLPLDMLAVGVGIMFGTGASAIIGQQLGAGKQQQARQNFTFITLAALVAGLVLSLCSVVFFKPLLGVLGATERLVPYCLQYGYILFGASVFTVVQVMYQALFITAGKSHLALTLTVVSGVLNIILDYLFIVVFNMGMAGAAWGTTIGRILGGVFPLIYFLKDRGMLGFCKPKWNFKVVLLAMSNGSSEMVSNLATGVTTLLFNLAMMKIAGENGVAAMTIVLYTQFVFTAVYMGFSGSAAPVISYHYGGQNHTYLQKLFRYCLGIIGLSTLIMLVASVVFATPLITLFTPQGTAVFEMAYEGYLLFIWNFLFAGFNIFASGLFTAFSNGKISALISFLRTLVFVVGCVLLLPQVIGMNGIWLSIPLAEFFTFLVAVVLVVRYGKQYHYLK